MRLLRFNLERYGAFTDRLLHFRPDAGLHIVHGANEAGKTSALSAIGDLLFGFERAIGFEGEAAGRIVDLHRRHTQIRQHKVKAAAGLG